MSGVVWPFVVVAGGFLLMYAGGHLAGRLHEQGRLVPPDRASPTSAQKRSARLMLGGFLISVIGVIWLLIAVGWRVAT